MSERLRGWVRARPKPSPGLLVGLLALFVATTGTAVAATGQVVNIADGATAANVAHVDGRGNLLTLGGAPSSPLRLYQGVAVGDNAELIQPTRAKIALTSLAIGEVSSSGGGAFLIVYIVTVPNGTPAGSCNASGTAFTHVGVYDVAPAQTVVIDPSSPIVMDTPAGQTRCILLVASSGSTSNAFLHVSAVGYVVSGTYTGPH